MKRAEFLPQNVYSLMLDKHIECRAIRISFLPVQMHALLASSLHDRYGLHFSFEI